MTKLRIWQVLCGIMAAVNAVAIFTISHAAWQYFVHLVGVVVSVAAVLYVENTIGKIFR